MARMNFDAKQFLLQHGERVGLYAAAGVMALLLLFGLKATAVGLGAHYAKDLNTKNDQVKRNIASSSPSDDQKAEIKKIDPKMNVQVAFEKIDADKYPAQAAWFRPVAPDENKRRNPHILQPVEFIAQVIYTQLRAYKLSPDKEKILVVEGAKSDATALKSFAGRFRGFGDVPGGMMGGMPGGSSGPPGGGAGSGFPGGRGPGTFPGGSGSGSGSMGPGGGFPGGRGGFPPGGAGMMGGMAQGRMRGGANFMNLKRDDDEVKTRMISIDRLPKETNVKPAEDILPVRMVEVVASFPYKQQLEEFRKALLMKNIYELFADPTSAPEFKGFDVERADVRPGQPENWAPVNLDQSFRPLQLLTGREYEADPPELEPVSFLGLVLPKLRQCREDQYPKIETDLKHLSDTLAKLKESRKGKVAKPANPFKDTEGVSIFDRGDTTPQGAGPGGAGMPFPPGSNRPTTGPTTVPGAENGFSAQEAVIPEYCLVRFFDPTVQPGHTYKYRIRIRMANPNYGKTKEVVGPSQAKEKELASDPVELPDVVVMPPEEYYYAVDMKALEPKERAFFNMPSATQAALTNQVPMQMQRWLDTVYDPKNPSVGFPVGDWVIADRALLTRGEYTGRTENVEVPIWDIRHDVFTLASFKRLGPRSRTSAKVPVPFGDETGAGDSILVDFQSGGQLTYDRFMGMDDSDKPKYTTIKDPPTSVTKDTRVPMEVLLMAPDGKLILHDGVEDIKKYKDRYDQVKKRLDDVKNHKEPSNTKPGGSPLNPFEKS